MSTANAPLHTSHTQTLYTYTHAYIHTHMLHSHTCTHMLPEEKYGHEVVVIPVDFSDGIGARKKAQKSPARAFRALNVNQDSHIAPTTATTFL